MGASVSSSIQPPRHPDEAALLRWSATSGECSTVECLHRFRLVEQRLRFDEMVTDPTRRKSSVSAETIQAVLASRKNTTAKGEESNDDDDNDDGEPLLESSAPWTVVRTRSLSSVDTSSSSRQQPQPQPPPPRSSSASWSRRASFHDLAISKSFIRRGVNGPEFQQAELIRRGVLSALPFHPGHALVRSEASALKQEWRNRAAMRRNSQKASEETAPAEGGGLVSDSPSSSAPSHGGDDDGDMVRLIHVGPRHDPSSKTSPGGTMQEGPPPPLRVSLTSLAYLDLTIRAAHLCMECLLWDEARNLCEEVIACTLPVLRIPKCAALDTMVDGNGNPMMAGGDDSDASDGEHDDIDGAQQQEQQFSLNAFRGIHRRHSSIDAPPTRWSCRPWRRRYPRSPSVSESRMLRLYEAAVLGLAYLAIGAVRYAHAVPVRQEKIKSIRVAPRMRQTATVVRHVMSTAGNRSNGARRHPASTNTVRWGDDDGNDATASGGEGFGGTQPEIMKRHVSSSGTTEAFANARTHAAGQSRIEIAVAAALLQHVADLQAQHSPVVYECSAAINAPTYVSRLLDEIRTNGELRNGILWQEREKRLIRACHAQIVHTRIHVPGANPPGAQFDGRPFSLLVSSRLVTGMGLAEQDAPFLAEDGGALTLASFSPAELEDGFARRLAVESAMLYAQVCDAEGLPGGVASRSAQRAVGIASTLFGIKSGERAICSQLLTFLQEGGIGRGSGRSGEGGEQPVPERFATTSCSDATISKVQSDDSTSKDPFNGAETVLHDDSLVEYDLS